MSAKTRNDERFFPRYLAVSKSFDGKLLLADSGARWDAQVLDVSRDGLGVLANTPVPKGGIIELHVEGRQLRFQIVYCNDDLIHRGRFRCGLRRVGSTENLINIFSAAGFVSDK